MNLPSDLTELAYLAGIFDGEGSICKDRMPSNGNPRFAITIVNTDRGLIEWLLTIGGSAFRPRRQFQQLSKKEIFYWKIASMREVFAFLCAVEPYIKIKRVRVREALRVLSERLQQEVA